MKLKYAIYYACIATVLFFGILACIYAVENHYKGKLAENVDAIIPDSLYFTRYSIEDIDSFLNNQESITDRIVVEKQRNGTFTEKLQNSIIGMTLILEARKTLHG